MHIIYIFACLNFKSTSWRTQKKTCLKNQNYANNINPQNDPSWSTAFYSQNIPHGKAFAFFADKSPDHSAVTSSLYLLKEKTTPESMLYKGRSFLHI